MRKILSMIMTLVVVFPCVEMHLLQKILIC